MQDKLSVPFCEAIDKIKRDPHIEWEKSSWGAVLIGYASMEDYDRKSIVAACCDMAQEALNGAWPQGPEPQQAIDTARLWLTDAVDASAVIDAATKVLDIVDPIEDLGSCDIHAAYGAAWAAACVDPSFVANRYPGANPTYAPIRVADSYCSDAVIRRRDRTENARKRSADIVRTHVHY